MSTNQSVDDFKGIRFKLLESDAILNIENVDCINTNHDTIDAGIFDGEPKRFTSGTVSLSITCFCRSDQIKQVDAFMMKEGYLLVSTEVPPLRGYFTEYSANALMAEFAKLEMVFIGSISYIADKAKEVKEQETKLTTMKVNRKKRTIKRKISFN